MDEGWPSEWLRGVLELAVLRVLAEGPSYGYAMTTRLREAGLGEVKGGTLYPLLARLEQGGMVRTEWQAGQGGPGRKYFILTDGGLARLVAESEDWRRFTDTTRTFVCELPRTPANHQERS